MTILSLKSPILEGKTLAIGSCLAIHTLGSKIFGKSSEIFGRLRKSSDVFGHRRVVFENPIVLPG